MYTIQDYEAAKAELQRWEDRWDSYSGNNPNKYQSDIKIARSRLRSIEEYLKETGQLPLTEQEMLEKKLDKAFPNAKSKEIVEFEGKKYQRRFFPLEKSRSRKTVTEWGKEWVQVEI